LSVTGGSVSDGLGEGEEGVAEIDGDAARDDGAAAGSPPHPARSTAEIASADIAFGLMPSRVARPARYDGTLWSVYPLVTDEDVPSYLPGGGRKWQVPPPTGGGTCVVL
jgi:hypothetical protein